MVRRFRQPRIGIGLRPIQPRNNGRIRFRIPAIPPNLQPVDRNRLIGDIGQTDVPLGRYTIPRGNIDIQQPIIPEEPLEIARPVGQLRRSQPSSYTDKKRRITISKNNLDPISSLLFSKAKYPDVDGYIYENPLGNNNQIRANYSDRENRSNPDFVWSLAAFRQGSLPVSQASRDGLDQFLNCLNHPPTITEAQHNDILFSQQNPYVYFDKSLSSVGQSPIRNMPSEILGKTLETADRVLSIFDTPQGQESNLGRALAEIQVRLRVIEQEGFLPPEVISEEDPEVVFYFESLDQGFREGAEPFMRAKQRDFRSYREEINQRVRNTLQSINLYEIISELLMRLEADLDLTREIKRVIRFLIARQIQPIVGLPIYLTATQSFEDDYEYTSKYVELETPYITNTETSVFLRDVQQPNYISAVVPKYNYFAKEYEQVMDLIDSDNVLSNVYAKQQYDDLNFRLNRGPTDEFKFGELGTILSLGSSIAPFDSLSSYPGEVYYNLFGSGLLNVTEEETRIFENKNKSIIIGGDNSKLSRNQTFYTPPPMSIGVQFVRSSDDNFSAVVNSIDAADPSSIIFENIQYPSTVSQGGTQNRGGYLYATEFLNNLETIVEFETDFIRTSLVEYDLNNLIFPIYNRNLQIINNNIEFKSLVISENDSIATPNNLDLLVARFFGQAVSVSRNNYLDVLQANNTQNTCIGYKISKSKKGEITNFNLKVQDIYIGNGSDANSRAVSYVDNQVQYGDEYEYDLYDYRLIYGTKYKFASLSPDTPLWVFEYYLGVINEIPAVLLAQKPNIYFNCYVESDVDYSVVEIPIYSKQFIEDNFTSRDSLYESLATKSSGIVYPTAKVLDRPPTAPILNIYPLINNPDQVKIIADLQTGENIGDQALPIVSIGDTSEKILELKEYQDEFINTFLPPGFLEFKNEGLSEIRNFVLYRTTNINLNVESYSEIYNSFDPIENGDVLIRSYTDMNNAGDIDSELVSSYAIIDEVVPNQNYYYTSIVEDFHGNPSNPSIVYRVRLLLEKGLLIPEIEPVFPRLTPSTTPQKNLTRYLQISPSTIQSEPFLEDTDDGTITRRSVGSSLGNSIEDQSYIVRITSKDTGRRFDIKLNFVVRVDGSPINIGT